MFKLLLGTALTLMAINSYAQNEIRMKAPISIGSAKASWSPYEPLAGDWVASGAPPQCTAEIISATLTSTTAMTIEGSTRCLVESHRTIQPREISNSGVLRNAGEPIIETLETESSVTRISRKITAACRYNVFSLPLYFWRDDQSIVSAVWNSGNQQPKPSDYLSLKAASGANFVQAGNVILAKGRPGNAGFKNESYICRSTFAISS